MKNTDFEAALNAFLLPPATSPTLRPQIRLTISLSCTLRLCSSPSVPCSLYFIRVKDTKPNLITQNLNADIDNELKGHKI